MAAGTVSQSRPAAARTEADALGLADVIALVGHELRTPLTTIGAAAEMLDAVQPAEAPAVQAILRRQVDRLLMLFEAALRSAEVVGGAGIDHHAMADASAVINELPEALAPNDGAIAVTASVEPGLPPLAIEPASLTIVLNNLMANAIGHSGGTVVRIDALRGEGSVLLRVSDNGSGVPAHLRSEFRSGGAGPGARARGGLGLHVARTLVRAYGGDIMLEDRDCGSCFVVSVPVREGS
jgi:signal transduction histidine kinase